ncbi:phospholipid-transporting ATPase ABCA1-like [Lepisosteus oculatus]|uniref:phospholipid-transporting ATPase ABCA1-like n=1 Tax=Lepisosteus oculatus TaxID=7918 RepID=UPI0035F51901
MGLLAQLGLLLWKNFTLRKRQKIRLFVELLWPLFLFFILVAVRTTNPPVYHEQSHYPNKAMPSAGILPWLQGMLCNLNNPSQNHPTEGETPGQVNNFNSSLLAGAMIELQSIVSDPTDLATFQQLFRDVNQWLQILQYSNPGNGQPILLKNILNENETFTTYLKENLSVPTFVAEEMKTAQIFPNKVLSLSMDDNLNTILCNKTELKKYIQLNSSAAQDIFQNISCSFSRQKLETTRDVLLKNLNMSKLSMAIPRALAINPREILPLIGNTTSDVLPVIEKISKLQKSALLSLGSSLDFTGNMFGSLNTLLCGKDAVFGQGNNSYSNSSKPQSNWINGSDTNSTNSNSSDFCQTFIETLESTPALRYVWSTFRPLLLGKILYSPDTPATSTIIREANSTFYTLGLLKKIGEAWEVHGPLIWTFLQNSTQINSLRALLNNPAVAAIVNLQLRGSGWTAERLSNFLYNGSPEARPTGMPAYDWRDAFNYTSEVLRRLTQFIGCLVLDKFEAVPSEANLVERSMKLIQQNKFWAGIVFEDINPTASQPPHFVKYKIRMDIDEVERTHKVKDRLWAPGARDNSYNDLRYIWGGFAYLQDMMDHGIIRAHTSKSQPLGVFVQQMPYPCYVNDVFLRTLARSLPLYMTLAWIFSVAMIVKSIVQEKEARLKEMVRMMGLNYGTYWLSWFISSVIPLSISALLLTLILKFGKVLRYSDPSVLFVFLVVFCISTIMECFFISVFFSKANLAAACGGIIYFVLYLPHILCFAWQDVLTFRIKTIVSLLSSVAFGFGCENFSLYEEQGIGIQWSNIGVNPVEGERYSFVVSIMMMLIDSFIYWMLTWYIENVFPGQYGIPRPWYFPFTASYWCGLSAKSDGDPDVLMSSGYQNGFLEPVPPNLKPGVSVRNLVKIYKTGKKVAVDGLSVDFYEDQITSFLGHNGAGKTTTMSILTGLFPPTSGTALINGKDIRTEMDDIRKHMGMCPQHNVLFNEMTVEEHIYFYARLKGKSSKEVKGEMDQIIKDVGLPHKRKDLVKNLSGGMQRKLSVAIAFVGGSRIVILDEPTAGVDPYARRGIWELLLKYKQGRTIILSTHHMDEADILGDRIAIISHGKMCCCGSSLFLKKCFGSGYYLTLVKAGKNKTSTECSGLRLAEVVKENDDVSHSGSSDEGIGSESESIQDISGIKNLNTLIKKHVPEARFLESIGQEITYILPYTGAQNGTFAQVFKELELEMSDLGISSYGISDTTLEEIFLKVAEDTGVDSETLETSETFVRDWKRTSRESKRNSISNVGKSSEQLISSSEGKGRFTNRVQDSERPDGLKGKGSYVISGWKLIRRQFLALFIKRFHHARRSRKGLIAQVVLPPVFVCLSLIFSLISPPFVEYPNLELQPWMYGSLQKTFFSNDAPDKVEVLRVADSLVDRPGFGTRCMKNNPILKLPCASNGSDWFTPSVPPLISEMFANGNWTMANPSPSCQCSTPEKTFTLPDCPAGAGGMPPPERIQNTTDTLQNLTERNMTDFLLKNYQKSGKNRYGGISVGGVNSQVRLNETEIAAVVRELKNIFNSSKINITEQIAQDAEMFMKKLGTKNNVKVWFYNKGWHAMVSFLNVANNAILRGNLPPDQDPSDYGITTYNHPLNLSKEQLSDVAMATSSTDVLVSICVIFAMSFIPASFVLFLIQERVTKAKHLQFVSGVNPGVYWVANFAWDMCNYTIPCLIVIAIFLCFQQKAYVSLQNLPALVLLLVLYGWSITPLMYPASFIFSVPSTAYVVLTCVNLFIGINGSVATFVMELLNDKNIAQINDIVKQVLLIFPHFCLGRGLIDMAKNQAMATVFERFGEDRFRNPLDWDMLGRNLLAMCIEGLVFFALTLLIQYRFFFKPRAVDVVAQPVIDEDEDVARERIRVLQSPAESDLLRICDLTKVYQHRKKPAVNRICVGVPAAECFGLLGVNGAGKTTTFKMLTGDISVSSGEAFLNGYSILKQMREVHQNMGYCPQFDAIDDLLSGREHLEFYARLRGVPEKEVKMVAEWGIKKLGLVKYSNKSAGTYSGGNKRKLSTAMALIGCPPVIFLDEPTTGMDPKARRFLWDCILSVIKEGRSVILTSHSMEECEALCTRMAIMVNGQFKCLGSIQHLKSRFGDGYTVTVRVGGSSPVLKPVEDFMRDTFPGSTLKEKHHNNLQYQLPCVQNALSKIFSELTRHRESLAIEDYSVSQTTLDQVFVNFAKHQHEEEDPQVYTNPVDVTSDEMPMQPLKNLLSSVNV